MNEAPPSDSGRTYPLSLLFLMLTGAAVLAATFAPVMRRWLVVGIEVDSGPTILISFLAGTSLGVASGLFQYDRFRGVIAGVLIGAVIGPLAGLLILTGGDEHQTLLQAALFGSAVLLLTAWFIRPPAIANSDDIES